MIAHDDTMNESTVTDAHPVTLHVYLGYRDASSALDWLQRAFGFEVTMQFPDEQGGLAHAELRLGDAAIVVFSDHDGYDYPARKGDTVGHGVYLSVPEVADVDTVFTTAMAAGATEIWKPEASEWNYRCRVSDPEGREWTFGTHRPGKSANSGNWSDD